MRDSVPSKSVNIPARSGAARNASNISSFIGPDPRLRVMKARLLVLALVALTMVSCRADSLELGYRYDGAVQDLEYVLTARAHARWEIGEPGEGAYTVRFKVEEHIEPQAGGGAIIDVTMTPLEVREQGLLRSEERRVGKECRSRGWRDA